MQKWNTEEKPFETGPNWYHYSVPSAGALKSNWAVVFFWRGGFIWIPSCAIFYWKDHVLLRSIMKFISLLFESHAFVPKLPDGLPLGDRFFHNFEQMSRETIEPDLHGENCVSRVCHIRFQLFHFSILMSWIHGRHCFTSELNQRRNKQSERT